MYIGSPEYYSCYVKNSHSQNTRLSVQKELVTPKVKTEYIKRSFRYIAPKLWHKLKDTIKNTEKFQNDKYLFSHCCFKLDYIFDCMF